MFPNSNVIFYAQDKNPADVKPAGDGIPLYRSLRRARLADGPLSRTALSRWRRRRISRRSLGRVCSNGRPVPVKNADWLKFVRGLRDAGMTSYKAAQSKSNEKMLDAADAVTTACSNCHDRYREKPGGVAVSVYVIQALGPTLPYSAPRFWVSVSTGLNRREIPRLRVPALRAKAKARDTPLGMTRDEPRGRWRASSQASC